MKGGKLLHALLLVVFLYSGTVARAADGNEPECVEDANPLAPIEAALSGAVRVTTRLPCPSFEERWKKDAAEAYARHFPPVPSAELKEKQYGSTTLTGSERELAALDRVLGAKPPSAWPGVAEGCKTILCALTRLLDSEEAAQRVLTAVVRNGYALSVDQSYSSEEHLWRLGELRVVDHALAVLPPELNHLPRLNQLYRVPPGKYRGNDNADAAAWTRPGFVSKAFPELDRDSAIHFQDSTFTPIAMHPSHEIWSRSTVVHEICHHYDFQGLYEENGVHRSVNPDWGFVEISWYRVKDLDWVRERRSKFVSKNAQENPKEDFAESCAAYVMTPKELKEKAPGKYTFLKKHVFNGKEFERPELLHLEPWPRLEALANSPQLCSPLIERCLKDTGLYAGKRSLPVLGRLFKAYGQRPEAGSGFPEKLDYRPIPEGELWSANSCLNSAMPATLQALQKQLANEPDFCERGGRQRIARLADGFCMEAFAKAASKHELTRRKERIDGNGRKLTSKAWKERELDDWVAVTQWELRAVRAR